MSQLAALGKLGRFPMRGDQLPELGSTPALTAALLVVVACSDERGSQPSVPIAPPPRAAPRATMIAGVPDLAHASFETGPGSKTPNLHADRKGVVGVTWVEPGPDGGHALRLRRRSGTSWSPTSTIASNDKMFVNWADFAAVASLSSPKLVAAWLETADHGSGYGIRWARSSDDGRTWSSPQRLHDHESGPEYGFISFAATGPEELAVFWLDGRASKGHEGGAMQLRTARIGPDGEPRDRRLVDDRVCDCW